MAVHSRDRTSLQFLRNHFSTRAESVNALGLACGANAAIDLPVTVCLPASMGGTPWQVEHDQSPPWRALKKSSPRAALGA